MLNNLIEMNPFDRMISWIAIGFDSPILLNNSLFSKLIEHVTENINQM